RKQGARTPRYRQPCGDVPGERGRGRRRPVIRRPGAAGLRHGSSSREPDDGGFETMSPSPAEGHGDDTLDQPEPKPKSKPRGPSLKARAVGYLSRREYARNELARKLQPYAEDAAEIDPVLDALEKEGWLSTERF